MSSFFRAVAALFLPLFLIITLQAPAQKPPELMKKSFTKKALAQMVYEPGGDSLSMRSVLRKNKSKIVVLDLWAGWCKDCIAVMEDNKALKEKFPKVKFIYLSLDRSDTAWHKAIEKHGLQNEANYWFKAGWKNDFTDHIDLNWIPRYLVLNKRSDIKAYYIVHPKDEAFIELLTDLSR